MSEPIADPPKADPVPAAEQPAARAEPDDTDRGHDRHVRAVRLARGRKPAQDPSDAVAIVLVSDAPPSECKVYPPRPVAARLGATLALRSLRNPDMAEGIRAQVIDKDRNPKWSPPRIEDVTPAMVAPYFAEIGADELKFS